MNEHRRKLIELLTVLDDEAFAWIALAMLPRAMMQGAHTQIWPDGLGGFKDRDTIEQIRIQAAQYVSLQT